MADDWAIYQKLWALLAALPRPIDERRMRLWVAGCCRRVLDHFESPTRLIRAQMWFSPPNIAAWRHEVAVAEQFADGEVEAQTMVEARNPKSGGPHNLFHLATGLSRLTPENASELLTAFTREFAVPSGVELITLLSDVFHTVEHPVVFNSEWRTSTTVGLARSMYESRDFSPMPILADALEEAGCDNLDILNHCRGDGPHVRGCWVVDLVLGKA